MADETVFVPFSAYSSDHDIVKDRFLTSCTLRCSSARVAIQAPGIAVFLDKGSLRVERITTLGAEKVTDMPFCPTGDDHFSFDWCLAAFASRTEQFVKVKVTVEPQRIGVFICGRIRESFIPLCLRLLVKGHAFKCSMAVVTSEALWVKTCPGSGNNLPSNRK
jgi:hypothetical protein